MEHLSGLYAKTERDVAAQAQVIPFSSFFLLQQSESFTMVKKNVQKLDQEWLQSCSASFLLSGWQDLTALVVNGGIEDEALFIFGAAPRLKWASLPALLHTPARTNPPWSWQRLFCFFRALEICAQKSSLLEAYWGHTDGLAAYSQLKRLSLFLQVMLSVTTASPVAVQVHSDLSLVTQLPIARNAETDFDWRPSFWPVSLCCPLSPRPLRPWLLWETPNIIGWETQARTRRMMMLVRRAMKTTQHTLQEATFSFNRPQIIYFTTFPSNLHFRERKSCMKQIWDCFKPNSSMNIHLFVVL